MINLQARRSLKIKQDLPYILESKTRPFYSFRGLKNQMWIRFAVMSWILEKMIEPLYMP